MKDMQDSTVQYFMKKGFASGVSMSWYPIFKMQGAVYRDKEGRERELFDILTKDYHVNSLCLHIFMGDASTDPWWGGGIDAEYCLKIAQEAKKYGMRIMIVLVMGSSWNNAGVQAKPVKWYGLSFDQLKQKVYDYVYETTRLFIDGGVTPEWVKIGNESNLGMFLPDGSTEHFDRLAELFSAGHDAVKAADPQIQTIVHLSNCEVTDYMLYYYEKLEEHHCRFDMIGLSFYPHSANPDQLPPGVPNIFEALRNTLRGLSERFHKPIMMVECGFDNADPEKGYGQFKHFLRILSESPLLAQNGLFFWEPEMIQALYFAHYPYNAWQEDGRPSRVMDAYNLIGERKK